MVGLWVQHNSLNFIGMEKLINANEGILKYPFHTLLYFTPQETLRAPPPTPTINAILSKLSK